MTPHHTNLYTHGKPDDDRLGHELDVRFQQGSNCMDVLYTVLSWGSPLGIALFIFFSASGAGIFFWGLSHLPQKQQER